MDEEAGPERRLNAISGLIERWWRWSTGGGKQRKLIGFGIPALLLVILVTGLTPDRAEDSEDRLASPTVSVTRPAAVWTAPAANEAGSTTATTTSTAAAPEGSPTTLPDGWEVAVVAEVMDGDTVVLEGGRRLRYIGIDSPETVAPGEPVACFGPEAASRNQSLVLGATVTLEADVNDRDRFDRLLRYVYLEDGRMVNEVLVAEGYAVSKAYEPDTKHQEVLDVAQEAARSGELGIWFGCDISTPSPTVTPPPLTAVTPEALCPEGCAAPPAGCAIKGNTGDERIYHVPGQRDYERTVIDPEKGERWFCTEDEAVANGWRKAQR